MTEDTTFQFPADLHKAMKHRLANRIFKGITNDSNNRERCICCDRRIGQQNPNTSCMYSPTQQLVFLGPGVPLLFIFIQNGAILLIILTLIFSIYSTISNLLGKSCTQDRQCKNDIFNSLSLSNKIDDNTSVMTQSFLIVGFLIIYIFFTQYFIYRIRKRNLICDEITNSPSDYSIIIKNLPQDVKETDIELMIDEHRRLLNYQQKEMTKNLSIRKIIISYSLENYLTQKEKQQKQFLRVKKQNQFAQFEITPIQKPTKTASIAIVIFNMQMSKEMFFQDETSFNCKNICLCEINSNYQIKNQPVVVRRAPEPDDILWQNADIPKSRLFRNISLSYILGIIILLTGGVIQYYLQYFQLKIQDPVIFSYFSYVTSLLVTIFNNIIVQFLIWVTQLQGNATKTDLDRSLMIKICLYSFFNAGVFYSLANILAQSLDQFDIQGGFSFEVILFFALNAFPPNLTALILTKLELPAAIFRYLLRKGYLQYNQKQANKLFELTAVDFPVQYSYVIKTIWLTCFYAPFAPVVVPISLAALLLAYFTQRELFRTSYAAPNMLSIVITTTAIRLMDFIGLFLSSGQLLITLYIKLTFRSQWTIAQQVATGLSVVLSLLLILLPSLNINKRLFHFEEKFENKTQYKDAVKEFPTTYEGTNPLSDPSERVRRSDLNLMKFLKIMEGLQMNAISQDRTISHPLLGFGLFQQINRMTDKEKQIERQSL